ncbi:hypothetical protein GLP37_08520 [Photobacterium phosphoreum]|uniref:hypothetical protein n=1 Tax=Photobacterium phosphoreum TaxID=659 RepID=UPI001E4560B5|nr:hypothetical protein [Photobacterium phosphoreum]MCD9502214.1 hypothetical protein [Photobacterium phosphoreum]
MTVVNMFSETQSKDALIINKYARKVERLVSAINFTLPSDQFLVWYEQLSNQLLDGLGLTGEDGSYNYALIHLSLRFLNSEVVRCQIDAEVHTHDWLESDVSVVCNRVMEALHCSKSNGIGLGDLKCVGEFIKVQDQETFDANQKMVNSDVSLGQYLLGAAILTNNKAAHRLSLMSDYDDSTFIKMMLKLYSQYALSLFPLEYMTEVQYMELWSICEVVSGSGKEIMDNYSPSTLVKFIEYLSTDLEISI